MSTTMDVALRAKGLTKEIDFRVPGLPPPEGKLPVFDPKPDLALAEELKAARTWLNAMIAAHANGKHQTVSHFKVTPALAATLLEKNTSNRPIVTGRVKSFARVMKAGRWAKTDEYLKISAGGELFDGQHRLNAVRVSGATVILGIIFGAAIEQKPLIDTGFVRTASDNAAIRGISNPLVASSLAAMVLRIRERATMRFDRPEIANLCEELYTGNPLFSIAINKGLHAKECGPPTAMAIAYWHIATNSDVLKQPALYPMAPLDKFWEQLAEGIDLQRDTPIWRLRRVLTGSRERYSQSPIVRAKIAAYIILTWNIWVKNPNSTKNFTLKWDSSVDLPAPE